MPTVIDFRSHLRRQLQFLEASCKSYDEGFTEEGIRIATIIRVLVNETTKQTPLLRRLNAYDIRLSTTVRGAPPTAMSYMGMGRFGFDAKGARYFARTTPDAIKGTLCVSHWWNQVVYIEGPLTLSRMNLVLTAADRDGGAHVDTKLTPAYESLMNTDGQAGWSFVDPVSGTFQPIMDAHLLYLREMGFELLHSPQLLALQEQLSV